MQTNNTYRVESSERCRLGKRPLVRRQQPTAPAFAWEEHVPRKRQHLDAQRETEQEQTAVQQEIGSDSAEGPCAPLEAICGAPSEPTTNSVGCGSVEPAPSAVNVPLELTADPPAAWAAPVVAAGGTEDCSQISGWPTHEAAHEATHEAAHQAAHRAARALVQELTRPIDRALQSACDGQQLDVVEVGPILRWRIGHGCMLGVRVWSEDSMGIVVVLNVMGISCK